MMHLHCQLHACCNAVFSKRPNLFWYGLSYTHKMYMKLTTGVTPGRANLMKPNPRRHGTQHNDTQHNTTKHNNK